METITWPRDNYATCYSTHVLVFHGIFDIKFIVYNSIFDTPWLLSLRDCLVVPDSIQTYIVEGTYYTILAMFVFSSKKNF